MGPGGDRRVVRDGHSELPDVQESESSETSGQGKKKGELDFRHFWAFGNPILATVVTPRD